MKMKHIVIIAALMAMGAIAVPVVLAPKIGVTETFSELRDAELGNAYVRGRYNGLLDGWDVSFFYRAKDGRLFA